MAQNELQIIVSMKDEFSKKLDGIQNTLDKSGKTAKNSSRGLGDYAKALGLIGTAYASLNFARSSIAGFAEDEQMFVRLAQLTKNSTQATDEQIYALKEQADALEQIGVISGGNILTLQGQLATYDLTTESIMKLTPALLDMAVAERGVNVTSQDMISFSEGISKALQGNYASLQKRGFILSEDTKKIIENGTEQERVNEIVKVMNSTYEGMNKTMAESASGSMAQFKNKSDAIKDSIGQYLYPTVGKMMDRFIDLITINGDVGTSFYVIGESIYRLMNLATGVAGSVKQTGLAVAMPFVTAFSYITGGLEKSTETLEWFADEFKNTSEQIQTDFSQIWGKTDYNPEGFDISKIGSTLFESGGFDDLQKAGDEITDELKKIADSYEDFAENIDDSLYDLRTSHKDKMASFREEIRKTRKEINELNNEFAKGEKSDKQKVAEDIVANEERIAEIQKELKTTVARDSVNALNAELAERQTAQEENAGFIKSLETEIAEVKRVNALTDLERAIEDYNARRALASQEYNEKMSALKSEIKEIKKKEEEEKSLYSKKRAYLMQLNDDVEKRHKLQMQNNLLTTKETIEKEIEYYKKLASVITAVRGGSTSKDVNRAIGKATSVNDAIISPNGDVITTHPDDYLIATKNPHSLGGKGMTLVITGNTFLGEEDMAEKVGDMIMGKLKLNTAI